LGIDFIDQTSPVGDLKCSTTLATPRVSTVLTLSSSVNYDDLECRTILVSYWVPTLPTPLSSGVDCID
jgi:hypothetical protein